VLTIDHNLQKLAYDSLQKLIGVGGCVIVMKPATGEILALVSHPDYDPNQIINIEDPKEFEKLTEDETKPFLNRAIQIKNPPSSTFKPLVGLAALEEKKLNFTEKYECQHKYILKGLRDRTYYCWGYHGYNSLVKGIAKSCNIFFYNVGLKLGSVPILNYAKYFGLNELSQIDLPGEIRGLVPSDSWKRKTFRQRWYDGDTLNISIGQGFLQFTPMGMAMYYAGLINNGIVYKPHILKEVRNPKTKELEISVQPHILREIPVKQENLDKIREGLRDVVKSGTTSYMNNPKIEIAGKTGTVQTFSITKEKEYLRKKSESHHAWFIGYAPYNGNPEDVILVTVFVQFGQSGSGGAAPIANRIFKGIFVEDKVPTLFSKGQLVAARKSDTEGVR
jgi:penicillin-binding protein 2